MSVTFNTAPQNSFTTRSYAVTVMVNGVASALGCTVTGNGTTTCTSNASVPVTAGQTINVRVVPTGTPIAGNADWSATYVWGGVPIA